MSTSVPVLHDTLAYWNSAFAQAEDTLFLLKGFVFVKVCTAP